MLAALALYAAAAGVWHCRNEDLEIRCGFERCEAAPVGEFTPMDVWADVKKGATVCAYTGCWETKRRARRAFGQLLFSAEDAPFSSAPDGAMSSDITLLIIEKDRIGFVRAGGFATPLVCAPAKAP